eukprot:CAMPEP_0179285154 /NCGR_PEP_ID=MMETSP0797-20121207/39057_1 /TAXON_ID=47934 /ORGANISM="Dinophysis acuminata, Strain DAEP01" /LENGTH=536 /DNA_ID=CAMNT_0020993953 /DNA_START=160 /DNA_END=1765 /DNA_ORIENTATION=+
MCCRPVRVAANLLGGDVKATCAVKLSGLLSVCQDDVEADGLQRRLTEQPAPHHDHAQAVGLLVRDRGDRGVDEEHDEDDDHPDDVRHEVLEIPQRLLVHEDYVGYGQHQGAREDPAVDHYERDAPCAELPPSTDHREDVVVVDLQRARRERRLVPAGPGAPRPAVPAGPDADARAVVRPGTDAEAGLVAEGLVQLPQEQQAEVVPPPHHEQQDTRDEVQDHPSREQARPNHGEPAEENEGAADSEAEAAQEVAARGPGLDVGRRERVVVADFADPPHEEANAAQELRYLAKDQLDLFWQVLVEFQNGSTGPEQHAQQKDHRPHARLPGHALPDGAPFRDDEHLGVLVRHVDELEVLQVAEDGVEDVAHEAGHLEELQVPRLRHLEQRRGAADGEEEPAHDAADGDPVGDSEEEVEHLRVRVPDLVLLAPVGLDPLERGPVGGQGLAVRVRVLPPELAHGAVRAALPPLHVLRHVLLVLLVQARPYEAAGEVRQLVAHGHEAVLVARLQAPVGARRGDRALGDRPAALRRHRRWGAR